MIKFNIVIVVYLLNKFHRPKTKQKTMGKMLKITMGDHTIYKNYRIKK